MKPVLAILIGLLITGSQAVAQSFPDTTGSSLSYGDQVRISVWQREELSGQFEVARDGSLIHPLYQEVNVAGVPSDRVEEQVDRYLSSLEADPLFVVQPLHRVAITGVVVKPDVYYLPTGTTIAEAVAEIGGVGREGNAEKVELIRNGTVTIIDLTKVDSPGANMPIRSSDRINVEPKQRSVFTRVFLPILSTAGAVASIVNIATR